MHTSDASGTESPAKKSPTPADMAALAAEVSSITAGGDPIRAATLLKDLEQSAEEGAELAPYILKCRAIVNRARWMEDALEALRRSFAEDRFADGLGQLRQALNLSRGAPHLALIASQAALREAEGLLPANWRIAEVVLQETAAVHADLPADSDLQIRLEKARADERLTSAIHKADRSQLEGRKEEARSALQELLSAHPGDTRLLDRIKALDQPEPAAAPAPLVVKMPAAALAPRPIESDLDLEGTPNDVILPLPRFWPTKIVIAPGTWNATKNFASLAGSTAMLIAASVLVWQHFGKAPRKIAAVPAPVSMPISRHPVEKTAIPESVVEKIMPEDEQAWNLVRSSQNAKALRDFLMAYPTSSHALRAKIKLASLAWEKADKTSAPALASYLRAYPISPYRKEAQRLELLAESKNSGPEDRETILGVVRSFDTQGGEYEDPVISGDEATVRFHPSDGALPETFTLVRQDGTWRVQSVR